MTKGTLTRLFRYPFKSMAGEALRTSSIGIKGLPGDRAWAVRDEQRGGIRGAKRFAELMSCRAYYPSPPAEEGSSPAKVVMPSGDEIATDDDRLVTLLSQLVGSPVTIWPLVSAEQLDHYRRGEPLLADVDAELRRVFARTADENLPDLSVFPPELFEYESPPGTYFDAFPLLILSRQSLEILQKLAHGHIWDVRRFRPNLLVDCPDAGDFPENNWEGRRLRIGSTVLQLEMNCPRCVMTTHGFDDLPQDSGIMRSLVQTTNGSLGIYASVIEPGIVRQGDHIELLD
jgi:uncharacterized protein YcbX